MISAPHATGLGRVPTLTIPAVLRILARSVFSGRVSGPTSVTGIGYVIVRSSLSTRVLHVDTAWTAAETAKVLHAIPDAAATIPTIEVFA